MDVNDSNSSSNVDNISKTNADETPKFYSTFNSLINSDDKSIVELKLASFRKLILDEYGKTIEAVKTLEPGLRQTMKKPQRLLFDDDDYYVAIDMFTNTYYICYRELLMVDIDFYKEKSQQAAKPESERKEQLEMILKRFQEYCTRDPTLLFRLYSSRNGVHGFLISRRCSYKSDESMQLMIDLKCDFYYVIYSYIRGWSVRLNKKESDLDPVLYKHICDVGTGVPDIHLLKLVDLHLRLVTVFKDVDNNSMAGL